MLTQTAGKTHQFFNGGLIEIQHVPCLTDMTQQTGKQIPGLFVVREFGDEIGS